MLTDPGADNTRELTLNGKEVKCIQYFLVFYSSGLNIFYYYQSIFVSMLCQVLIIIKVHIPLMHFIVFKLLLFRLDLFFNYI